MPSRRAPRRALVVLAAWTVFGLLIAEQTSLQLRLRNETRPLWSVLAPPLFAAWLWALYTPLVVRAARRLRALRERLGGAGGWAACLALHALLALLLMVVGTVVWTWVRPFIDGVATPWPTVFAYSILLDTASYVAVVTLAEATALARTAADLQERLDEARLHALEAQLRPHFLYNTLNLIAELVHDEPDVADEMLTRLGLLLRRAYQASAHLVPLGEELAFALAYAEILARRYRDRVTLAVDVPDALRALPVPAFALQPLVENAFRHGVERRESHTCVEIAGGMTDGALELRVTDRATSRPRRWSAAAESPAGVRGGDRVGLANTRERLRALYGGGASLTLDHRPGATTATLRVPATAPQHLPAAGTIALAIGSAS